MIFVGFPVWWVLGLGTFIFLLMTVPMTLYLYRHRADLVVPRGFGLWLFFLVWVLLGVGVLWAQAPGAALGGGMGRLLVFSWRVAWYVAATVVLLFIGNLRERDLPAERVARLLGLMFVFTTIGGLVGSFFPTLELTSPMEMLLPGGLAKNEFMADWIHPKVASVESILGFEQARPMAPFPYANTWGSAYAFFLPFFIMTWLVRGSRARRVAGGVVLLVSLWPVVYSLNRGLWLALALMALFGIAKILANGDLSTVRRTVTAMLAGAVLIAASPLPGMVQARLDNPHSNNRRGLLASQTVRSAMTGSPIVGFGSTRDVQGNLTSVAGGDRPGCRACGAPPLGTQGHIWLLIFATGLVGTVTFLLFFGLFFFRHWRSRMPYCLAGCAVLISFGLFVLTYDLVEVPLFTVMIAVALMWRARRTAEGGPA
ncbi:hypothetical protein SMC26_11345 [Actinomadura fulvescens]|uniref:hypothetical protein n=1 Tax=Actinomadura fulvescens TaxID=46160 RepID=UPI0031CEAF4D